MIAEARILAASILVVDDQMASVTLLDRTLRGAGYTNITTTCDPRTVAELHRANRYDLILLDLQMPEMDGFAVMRALTSLEVDDYLSVLAVTASTEQRVRALQSGAKDFVSKPFNLAEILTRVHNLLEVRLLHEMSRAHVQALELLARQDALTGLANRREADERVQMAILHGRRSASAMAVIYLDLDGFKAVNDTWGHGVGDLLLKGVSQRLVAAVRAEDTVARLGGDEFMIALFAVKGASDAVQVAQKLIQALGLPFVLEGHEVLVTASAGLALYPDAGEDVETLVKHADLALYQAKRQGKNTVRVFELLADAAGPPESDGLSI